MNSGARRKDRWRPSWKASTAVRIPKSVKILLWCGVSSPRKNVQKGYGVTVISHGSSALNENRSSSYLVGENYSLMMIRVAKIKETPCC
ncbi:hypothetical protein CEXT_671981 [Caerostris extrusa]|uniref:Uncharacterized protein n=1 Tax=Caerostris extrusa TaxID=172846 RepID=A0AAV4TY79_CAEEX|nr:hypothetical protein CEXT_671981 [Caerostris extrusa]